MGKAACQDVMSRELQRAITGTLESKMQCIDCQVELSKARKNQASDPVAPALQRACSSTSSARSSRTRGKPSSITRGGYDGAPGEVLGPEDRRHHLHGPREGPGPGCARAVLVLRPPFGER